MKATGLEPATYWLKASYATIASCLHNIYKYYKRKIEPIRPKNYHPLPYH